MQKLNSATQKLAAVALFGSLSTVMTSISTVPFPLIPYLFFNFGEIPVVLAFFVYGPSVSFSSMLLLWLIENFVGTFVPIGPLMQLAALSSMLGGFYLGSLLSDRLKLGNRVFLISALAIGMTFRIAVMSVVNYVVIGILFPSFTNIAAQAITLTLGIPVSPTLGGLFVILAITAVFNVIQTFLSSIPSYLVALAPPTMTITRRWGGPWVVRAGVERQQQTV